MNLIFVQVFHISHIWFEIIPYIIYIWKIKHVPNYQPDILLFQLLTID